MAENTLFSLFYFHLGLATLFSPPFDFKTPPLYSFLPFLKIIWPSRHSFQPFSKSIGPCDTLFTRFQNRLVVRARLTVSI